jgi:hypothetical protein
VSRWSICSDGVRADRSSVTIVSRSVRGIGSPADVVSSGAETGGVGRMGFVAISQAGVTGDLAGGGYDTLQGGGGQQCGSDKRG